MEGHARTSPNQNAATENRRAQTHQTIDPSDIAHHLRVAADKYHELARTLLEDMNEAIQALPDERKPAYRHTREALAKLFDDQASDAMRLALLFDDLEACELQAALDSIEDGNARKVKQDRLAAGTVGKPAEPPKFSRDAGHNELHTDLAAPPVPTDDHAACGNHGSLQHTPSVWIGNEQFNRRLVGGAP